MVGFHPINKTMTVGTFMFIGSMIIIALGALFHYLHYSASIYLPFLLLRSFLLYDRYQTN